jgi:CheY-like chemotaxis protein
MGLTMPILLLSSNPPAAREREGAALLDAILAKPVLRADLYRRLREVSGGEEEAAPLPTLVLTAPQAPAEQRLMRVLAAEDNKTNQLVFQKMVRGLDIELVFAGNGREAVDLWGSFRPDLIFMDISMPEMDGKQAATAIRAAEGPGVHVPIVALTAHAMEGDAEAILAAGIDHYLTKPLRKAAIVEALSRHCPKEARPIATPSDDAA